MSGIRKERKKAEEKTWEGKDKRRDGVKGEVAEDKSLSPPTQKKKPCPNPSNPIIPSYFR